MTGITGKLYNNGIFRIRNVYSATVHHDTLFGTERIFHFKLYYKLLFKEWILCVAMRWFSIQRDEYHK